MAAAAQLEDSNHAKLLMVFIWKSYEVERELKSNDDKEPVSLCN